VKARVNWCKLWQNHAEKPFSSRSSRAPSRISVRRHGVSALVIFWRDVENGLWRVTFEDSMILCIDDEPRGLQVRQMVLESQGYRVITATDGRRGLELFAANPVCAVVLDYAMPDMDGAEVAAELKRIKPEVKILLLSAYVDVPEEVMQLVDARAVKGTSPMSFLTALRQLLSR
jgi:CheY-like chemotaxis protein